MLGGKLVEITDDSNEAYTADNEMKFKTTMPKSSLCEYIDACMLDKETVSVPNTTSVDPGNVQFIKIYQEVYFDITEMN